MALQVVFTDPHDAIRVVDALLAQARHVEGDRVLLAARYRSIADDIGDALDRLPAAGGPWANHAP